MGSFAVTASTIAHQDKATQVAIRTALERRASTYKTPAGLELPVAFKIGAGQKASLATRTCPNAWDRCYGYVRRADNLVSSALWIVDRGARPSPAPSAVAVAPSVAN
jgi:hypothetical protein